MISQQNFTEPEVAVYIAVRNYIILLHAVTEASACARNSTTSTALHLNPRTVGVDDYGRACCDVTLRTSWRLVERGVLLLLV